MQEVFEKILSFIESEIQRTPSFVEHDTQINILNYVQQLQDEYNNGWIPCSERLPDVPEGIEDSECQEFNVTIKGAEQATTLKYAPDGTWFDDDGEIYGVIAWQSLPETYKEQNDD